MQRHLKGVIAAPSLTFRTIAPDADAAAAIAHQRDACAASFGDDSSFQGERRYLAWLRGQVEEFPDGCVLAYQSGRCVGQLEMSVPYGLTVAYVSLFYVTPAFRGRGYGQLLHDYAERYVRSWEANRIELHASPTNTTAMNFYHRMGYRRMRPNDLDHRLWRLAKDLGHIAR